MLYVICYDIVSDKRRKKMADVLLDFGRRVQKSAFECDLNEAKLRALLRKASPHLDSKTDTLRIYRVCAACLEERELLGIKKGEPPPKIIIL